jgi:hypothetical protein
VANGDGTKETLLHGLRQWPRNPSNWLSLGSIAIAAVTFLYVQFYPGSVTIYLPRLIAVSAPPGAAWRLLVNVSLFNEAPSTKVRVIENAPVSVRVDNAAARVKCQWIGTTELILTAEYRQRYGEPPPGNARFAGPDGPPTSGRYRSRSSAGSCRRGCSPSAVLEGFPSESVAPVPVEITMEVRQHPGRFGDLDSGRHRSGRTRGSTR